MHRDLTIRSREKARDYGSARAAQESRKTGNGSRRESEAGAVLHFDATGSRSGHFNAAKSIARDRVRPSSFTFLDTGLELTLRNFVIAEARLRLEI